MLVNMRKRERRREKERFVWKFLSSLQRTVASTKLCSIDLLDTSEIVKSLWEASWNNHIFHGSDQKKRFEMSTKNNWQSSNLNRDVKIPQNSGIFFISQTVSEPLDSCCHILFKLLICHFRRFFTTWRYD